MQFEEMLKKEHDKGNAQGRNEGRNEERARMLTLISNMASNGESEYIPRLSEDEEFCEKMLEKYNLSM